jgi:hypothetical protein
MNGRSRPAKAAPEADRIKIANSDSTESALGAPRVNAAQSRNDQSCKHWTGSEYCAATSTRLYIVGRRCPDHTPARLAGRQEPPSEPLSDPALSVERGAR